MKKTLTIVNLIFFFTGLCFFIASCEKKNSNTGTQVVLDYANKQFNNVPLATAQELSSNYGKNIAPLFKEKFGFSDARTAWFSLDELKHFVWQVEHYATTAGVGAKADQLGVRIYFGQYPTKETMQSTTAYANINPDFANRHTLFFVPTFRKDSLNLEFSPVQAYNKIKNGQAKEILPFDNQFRGFTFAGKDDLNRKMNFQKVQPDNETGIMNHAGLCPPCGNPPKGH